MYLSELAPVNIRGSLVALQQLMITIGILLSYWIAYGTSEPFCSSLEIVRLSQAVLQATLAALAVRPTRRMQTAKHSTPTPTCPQVAAPASLRLLGAYLLAFSFSRPSSSAWPCSSCRSRPAG